MTKLPQQHPLLWAYLFFAYFSVSVHALIYFTGMSGFVGLRQSIVVSCLWLIPLLLWPRKSKLIAGLIAIPLLITSLSAFGYWLIYGQDFSQSVIFIIFESNPAESSEFIQSYFQWWLPLTFILFAAIPLFMWIKMSPHLILSNASRYGFLFLSIFIISWPFLNTLLIKGESLDRAKKHFLTRMQPASPWNLGLAYLKYEEQLQVMQVLLAKNAQLAPLENLTVLNAAPDTVVLVIGESTNRQRMSLYGYPRETTPRLNAVRDELLVFNNVVTPRPYTIEALQQALSFADSKHPELFFSQASLLNMMKQAGYEISWITNQQTQTKRNTLLTMMSQLADHQVYLNNNHDQNANQYDGAVIAPFIKALQQGSPKKFIVVHLLGTHRKYHFRYPDEYTLFTNNEQVPKGVKGTNLEEYNSYDNAVLYNDYVISQIIESIRLYGEKNTLLTYFSDHGEEVYDYPEKLFSGRNEAVPTPAMYTVPFLIWSPDSSKLSQWRNYVNRPFSLADFIYTFPDMVGIDFDKLDHTRSLVSKSFQRHPRWIGNPLQPKTLQPFDMLQH